MRRRFLLACAVLSTTGAACTEGTNARRFLQPMVPTAPSEPAPAPRPMNFPSITVGEVVRFQVATDDWACSGTSGRCRSYNITAPSDGLLSFAITSTSGDTSFLGTLELYVVPGADEWEVGPGPQIGARVEVRAGSIYEIRMFSAVVPSLELELRTRLAPR
jgi:hypothetical protein